MPGEQVLLDENVEAEGHDFFSLGAASISVDGHTLAFSVDVVGDERYTLRFKDLRTGELYDDVDRGHRRGGDVGGGQPHRLLRRRSTTRGARTPSGVTASARACPPPRSSTSPTSGSGSPWAARRSDKYVFIAAGSSVTSEVFYGDAADGDTEFVSILPRRDGVEYSVEHAVVGGEDRFLILHNDGAENFTLVEAPVSDPTAFRTLIEHRADVRLDAVDAFERHLVVSYRSDALPRIQLWPIAEDGTYGAPEEITFETELTSSGLSGNPNWSAPVLRVGTTSFIVPVRVYDIDLATGERTLLREQTVLGDYRPEEYVERRDWALAPDGTRIPVSIIHRAGLTFPAPTLLYGYGAYESCEDPRFSIARLSLLDRGVVFAIAHVRGGGEMGRPWYEHGKMLEKKNTFIDFIAAGAHLVGTDVTRPENLVAMGGSAGGLLMGAVANMAPELFAGILAQVPFVDALTTILDPSLPLTVTEWDEWGNPLASEEVYRYMKSYSPYENVEAKDYPAILAMTSLNDTRVYYVEPAKWVAALRHSKTDAHPVLLKTEMSAGHGGISGRYERWKEAAFMYAWVLATADRDHHGAAR